ncbi:hypothetical protein [Rhizobium leucaenae]|uniref:hypothetical protein n=1 Tax=Rhizobium leucaenae TaxID=29450 RepID=UPI0012E9AD6F|nr:hypothetical protein [Rhizobium leucaenae]
MRVFSQRNGTQNAANAALGRKYECRVELVEMLQKITAETFDRCEGIVAREGELLVGESPVIFLKRCAEAHDIVEMMVVEIGPLDEPYRVAKHGLRGVRLDLSQSGYVAFDAPTRLTTRDDARERTLGRWLTSRAEEHSRLSTRVFRVRFLSRRALSKENLGRRFAKRVAVIVPRCHSIRLLHPK